jgi:hypothetical protein
MLTKKQLEDAATCNTDKLCSQCSIPDCNIFKDKLDCISGIAQTALAYRKMLERLEWVEVGEREVERKMVPAILCPSCDSWKEEGHKPDCELAALLKEVENSEVEHGGT